jgi:Cu2+-exporting ATPase
MPPALAAVLMSVSTIVVALNAELLRRVQLRPPELDRPVDRVRVEAPVA